ncbi:MAG: LacI family DNA-binding transcriptional regulator [Alphaproteobacteria bacterium]
MGRPTIRDLAEAADVSVSTVNRVIGGRGKVREATIQRVLAAAETIGFYGLGAIQQRMTVTTRRYEFAVILLQRNRRFYQALARALDQAAAGVLDADVRVRLSFIEDLSPDHVAARIAKLGAASDGLAVVAAEHPLVTEAIDDLLARGVPVFSLISPLSARGKIGFVGLDNWKVGRTAAWAFDRMCRMPGKIGILVGNHRYRCQELNESGFRSYFREFGAGFALLEPLSTFESAAIAREMTEKLLADHQDLRGLFISGGGITGTLAALRESGRVSQLVSIGYELMETTKAALMDGTLTLVISHPLQRLAAKTIAAMVQARSAGDAMAGQTVLLPFDIHTAENL